MHHPASAPATALRLTLAFGLAAAGCGTPDNQVFGGVASTTSAFPSAEITSVESAIHGIALVTNLNPNDTTPPQERSVVILSAQRDLCGQLQTYPNYFKSGNAPTNFAALILMTPTNTDGDFFLQATNSLADASLLSGNKGSQVALFPGAAGDISVTEFNTSGQARGSFSLVVVDPNNVGYPVYGRFKTQPCGAIAQAFIPRVH